MMEMERWERKWSPKFVCFLFCSVPPSKALMHQMWVDKGADGGESATLINGSCMGCWSGLALQESALPRMRSLSLGR